MIGRGDADARIGRRERQSENRARPSSAKDSIIAGLRPTRSPIDPMTMAPMGRVRKPTPNVASDASRLVAAIVRRKERAADIDREKRVGHEIVEFERVADDDGGHMAGFERRDRARGVFDCDVGHVGTPAHPAFRPDDPQGNIFDAGAMRCRAARAFL